MPLARFERDFTDEAGNLLTGNVSVQVRRMTGGMPQLYSDREGASALGNPFINDGGRVAFHAEGNAYRVTVTQGAFSRELTYVALGLAAETDFTFAQNQGEWSALATYARGDYVIHDGLGLFISAQDGNLNHAPDSTTPGSTAYWTYYPGVAGPPGEGLHFDIQVDELADRAAYDAEAEGFAVLVSDVGDGRAAVYVMGSDGSGDWGAAAYVTGAPGAGDVVEAADRAALKALDTSTVTLAYLTEEGREGMFKWDGSDLSSILTIDSQTTTAVNSGTGVLTKAAHGYLAGEALVPTASVNGLTAGTKYYAIRIAGSEDTFKLASSWANAMAGTAVTLTATTNVTLKRLLDPEEGVYVVKTGDDLGGADGAFVRADAYRTADMWGVKHDGSTDDTRAMNAAALFISERGETLNLLAGDHFLDTDTISSYAGRAIGNYNIGIRGRDGWRIVGAGVDKTVFTHGPNGNYTHTFFIMDCAGFEFAHVGFVGNNTGLAGSDNNGALMPYCVNEFWFHDIATSTFQGSHIVGNFWFNGDFERIFQSVPANASGFDCASIQNVKVDRQVAVGAGTGAGQGFQHSFDSPNDNPAFNTTGVVLRDDVSNHFRVQCGDYSGFATGVAIFEAVDFWIEGNSFHDNYKATGDGIYGALVGPSDSTVMWGATIRNNKFARNGTPSGTAGVRGGLLLNSNVAAVHAEVSGNQFYDNAPAGIAAFGSSTYIRGIENNDFGNISGSDQTLSWSGNPLLASQTREVADAATNTVSTAQKLSHSTSGTAATSFGVAQDFELESGAGNRRIGARLAASLNSATDGAENVALDFYLMKAGAVAARFFRMQPAGLFLVGDTAIAGIDFGVNLQSGFPQSWQYNVSAANGNLYYFDATNGLFPFTIKPGTPSNAFQVAPTGNLIGAGTTAFAPLVFASGVVLTTPSVGAVEFDGKVWYATAIASSRQVVNAEQISILTADRTGSDVNTAQAVFGASEDAISLAANTTYEFEALYYITRAAGTTSHTMGVLFAVGGSLTSIDYLAQVTNPTGNALANVQQIMGSAATLVTLTAANTSATENLLIKLRGTIRTNGAGTITPQFQFSAAPGGAPTIKRNSFFRCWAIGTDTVAKVGNWA